MSEITKELLEQELYQAIATTADDDFMSYSMVSVFDELFFPIHNKVKMLVDEGENDLAFEVVESLANMLAKVETDDDMFPTYEIELLCKLVDPEHEHSELWEIAEVWL